MSLYQITPHPNKMTDCSFCQKKQPTLYVVRKDAPEKEHERYSKIGGFMICSECWLKAKN